MRFVLPAMFFLLFSAFALAEDDAGDAVKDEITPEQKSELARMKNELGLSDEQTDGIRKAFAEANRRKDEKIKETLTPEQAEKYEQMKKNPAPRRISRFGFGGRGGGIEGMPGASVSFSSSDGFEGITAEKMKEKLGLDDEQFKSASEILKKHREKNSEIAKEAMKDFDFGSLMDKLEKLKEETMKQIRKILNDKQRSGFEKMLEEARESSGPVIIGGMDGEPFDPNRIREDIEKKLKGAGAGIGRMGIQRRFPSMDEIRKDLGCTEDEAAVLIPKIEKIREACELCASEDARNLASLAEFMEKEKPKPEDLRARVDQLRAKREESKRRLAEARRDIVDLLTYEQEAKLVILGVLE